MPRACNICVELPFILPAWNLNFSNIQRFSYWSKEIQNSRDLGVLSSMEVAIAGAADIAPSKAHNMIDAIGIGLWELKRNAI